MEFKKTITTAFIVPTLGIPKEQLNINDFINGYSKDAGREVQYENCIYVLFRPSNVDRFRLFLEKEYERVKVVDDYDYEGGYVIVVYELDKKYSKDFSLVRQGKYSKTSKQFQEQFSKMVKINTGGNNFREDVSLQYRVFTKSKDLVEYWETRLDIKIDEDQELWNGFHEEMETLYIDKIRENDKQSIGERANS
jgi:hypothetical protein